MIPILVANNLSSDITSPTLYFSLRPEPCLLLVPTFFNCDINLIIALEDSFVGLQIYMVSNVLHCIQFSISICNTLQSRVEQGDIQSSHFSSRGNAFGYQTAFPPCVTYRVELCILYQFIVFCLVHIILKNLLVWTYPSCSKLSTLYKIREG